MEVEEARISAPSLPLPKIRRNGCGHGDGNRLGCGEDADHALVLSPHKNQRMNLSGAQGGMEGALASASFPSSLHISEDRRPNALRNRRWEGGMPAGAYGPSG